MASGHPVLASPSLATRICSQTPAKLLGGVGGEGGARGGNGLHPASFGGPWGALTVLKSAEPDRARRAGVAWGGGCMWEGGCGVTRAGIGWGPCMGRTLASMRLQPSQPSLLRRACATSGASGTAVGEQPFGPPLHPPPRGISCLCPCQSFCRGGFPGTSGPSSQASGAEAAARTSSSLPWLATSRLLPPHFCQHCCLAGVGQGQACDIIVLTDDITRRGCRQLPDDGCLHHPPLSRPRHPASGPWQRHGRMLWQMNDITVLALMSGLGLWL